MKAAFLDRDGVINVDTAYLYRWADFRFMPGAVAAMRELMRCGFEIIVVTNQSGIARGYYSEQDFLLLTEKMLDYLSGKDVAIRAVYYCPHLPDGIQTGYAVDCDCRKPKPGMILSAARDFDLDLGSSILIGDKTSDIEASNSAGVGKCFLVGCTSGQQVAARCDGAFESLLDCVVAISGRGADLIDEDWRSQ